ncbi:hypothetical protein NBRC116590_21850 [Pelagimonas sp. KU-00592-HH]|uniref:CDP-alcohol phosphatidyltransferase family protein n=1 Tax=Pelagimonas sp. KU-00592-HH TaxID=3127651 RepID=UPI00310A30A7
MQDGLSFKDILRDLRGPHVIDEFRTSWAIALLYRMTSPPFVWICARLGLTPMAVTALGFLLALSMPLQAMFLPVPVAVWALFISGALFQILDCVDGTLARLTGRTSLIGADLDYLSDMHQHAMFYGSLGLLADRLLGTGFFWTTLGLVAVVARLLARLVREQVSSRQEAGEPSPWSWKELPVAFVAGLSGLIPFGALAGPWMGHVIVALIIYGLLDIVDAMAPMRRPPYRD